MNASGAREGIPEGPGPTHRVAGERGRFQPQLVDNLVEELDRSVSEPLARDLNGLAEPQPRPIHGDRSNTLEMIEQRQERERGRARAVQQHDRWALARLDDMDAST